MVYGFNSFRPIRNGFLYPTHAEIDVIEKSGGLSHGKKKKCHYDMIAIRLDKRGRLKCSRPCSKCIEWMNNCRKYIIDNVYYSNSENGITCIKLSDLTNEPAHLSKRFRNH